ncbi:hypothetical protein KAH37_05415 [bacterium]|nr:hypothetical protein [bacterium]
MYSCFFVTHGELGEMLVSTANMILKEDADDRVKIFSVDYSMLPDMQKIQKNVEIAIDLEIKKSRKVILFTDIFGGSPSNLAFTFSKRANVDVLAGVNLPMVLSAFERRDRDEPFEKTISAILKSGKGNIVSAKQLMEKDL